MAKPKHQPRSAQADDVAIGKRIRQRRLEQNISQAELGNTLGVSFQQIQKYEKGVNRVGATRLAAIAQALGCDLAFFLPTADRPKAASVLDDFLTSRDGLMIAQAFVRIADENIRHTVAKFIDGLSRGRIGSMQAAE
ncbi:helix-turn-helix domain-containing protein [Bradyrhizobium sp. PMVTL-01]|uniref:helix-turn-helix domain-containing protein n=1 Tax=Bradyrhizobium sp. PMVTL-01 TaxID=3434999 RepID=UPI003F72FFB2